ncbi:MAG: c-type cytochrome [Actinomycetota bacterium]
MTPARLALLAVVLAFAGVSCAYFTGEQTTPFRPPLAEPTTGDVGHDLYLRDCAWCHGNEAQGTRYGPDLITGQNGAALTDFMLRTGRMPLSFPEETVRHREAAYEDAEIVALVEYATSLDDDPGPEIPDADPDEGELGPGAELYLENCAACHSTTGVGGALTSEQDESTARANSGLVAPGLAPSTAVEIEEAMLTGPGNMPVFAEDTFSEQERSSIVRYVEYLQDPNNRGGLSIGLIGPVAEGAVAWLAIGLLTLVIRWIGTRVGDK